MRLDSCCCAVVATQAVTIMIWKGVLWIVVKVILSNKLFYSQEVAKWSAMPNSPSMYGMAVPSCPPLVMCCPHKGAAPQPGRQQPWGGLIGVTWYMGCFFPADPKHHPLLITSLRELSSSWPVALTSSHQETLSHSWPIAFLSLWRRLPTGSAATLSCMTEPAASAHRVGLGTARDPHHASTSDFMNTSDSRLHCYHLHHQLLHPRGNLDHPTPWRVINLSWQQSWPVWEVLAVLPPSSHSPAIAFHSHGITDHPFVRLLIKEQNFFASCLTACEGHSAHCHKWWQRQWLEEDVLLTTQASPSQHQQLLAVSSGLHSTLTSCPRLIIIFHRRLSYSLSHGSCIFPGITTSPAIHFQPCRSSWGESCGSQWV